MTQQIISLFKFKRNNGTQIFDDIRGMESVGLIINRLQREVDKGLDELELEFEYGDKNITVIIKAK